MARKYWRASFHADSTASDPPVVKNTRLRSPGASSARRAASCDRGRVGVGPEREVVERLRLRPGGFGQLGAAVADLHGEQARQAVEQPVAGGVPQRAALAAGDDVHRRLGAVPAEAREVHPEVAVGERAQFVGVGHVTKDDSRDDPRQTTRILVRSRAMGQGISEVLPFAIGIAISPIPIIAIVLILFSNRATVNGLVVPARMGGRARGRRHRRLPVRRRGQRGNRLDDVRQHLVGQDRPRRAAALLGAPQLRQAADAGTDPRRCPSGWRRWRRSRR